MPINFDMDRLSAIFTDRPDESLLISLSKARIARDPVTGFTLLGGKDCDKWEYAVITLDRVKEDLIRRTDKFWDYVGVNKFYAIHNLDNTKLTDWISAVINYRNPWNHYVMTINSAIELFIAGYNQGRY